MMYFSIHPLLLLIQKYGLFKWQSKIDVWSTKAQVLSFPFLDLGQAWREALLCFLQNREALHPQKEQKIMFQMSLGFLECGTHDTDLLLVYVNSGIKFLPRLCAQEVGQSTIIVLCVRLPSVKNSSVCLLNCCLKILWLRKCFLTLGAMPAMQQLQGSLLPPSLST